MAGYAFEALGMLFLPLVILSGAAPNNSVRISKVSLMFASLIFVWPLSTICLLLFDGETQSQVLAVFVATALGVVATIICLQALPIRISGVADKSDSQGGSQLKGKLAIWWSSFWRLLVLWFCISAILISFGQIYLTPTVTEELSAYFGIAMHIAAIFFAVIVVRRRTNNIRSIRMAPNDA